ncbi:MAG: hypothetical protein RL757_2914, partial [Bacteroidota bacterium]
MNNFQTVRILLVEDNPGDVRLTREAFRDCRVPVKIDVVMDGDAAIKHLTSGTNERPDLILLDLNIPKRDGREVLQAIKSDADLRS